ncbi:MAG: hypothetical protein GY781_16000 [Gammaproteobacteria bacterium]|nr:hypothetical protein [Gammaproteobacteria bacterium]
MTNKETKTCPFCKEEIRTKAIKCKHCHSRVEPDHPSHEGICPFCKEDVKLEAIKCKHCKSSLSPNIKTGCGCKNSKEDETLTALQQFGLGNIPIRDKDLKCALEYLDCLNGPLSQGVCQMLHTLC